MGIASDPMQSSRNNNLAEEGTAAIAGARRVLQLGFWGLGV